MFLAIAFNEGTMMTFALVPLFGLDGSDSDIRPWSNCKVLTSPLNTL